MPIKWFDLAENSPYKVANSLSSNGRIAKQFFNVYISHIFAALGSIIFGVTAGLIFDWRTGLVALGILPILGVVSALQSLITLGKVQTSDQVYKQSTEAISECISNLKTILSFCGENKVLERYNKILTKIENQQIKNCLVTGAIFGLSYTALYIIYGTIFHVASIFIKQYGVAAEDSFAVIFVINFAAIIGGQNIKQIPDLVKIKIALRDIFKVLDSCDEDQLQIEEKSALINRPIVGNIEFREVSFKYQSRQETVLSDVSFSVKSGEFAALVGPSGCGKSTILSLLLRFYEPTSGQIIVDGVDLRDFDVHCLRHYFGTVGQEPTLFDETVLFNIAYSKGTLTEEEMRLALRILNLACEDNGDGKEEEFLQRKAGPRGSHLSGGQKQRVAIARTAVRFPSLLLLDEATSALDKENARIAEEALRGVMEKKTVINVSHKLESLRDFDKIFVLKKGSIVESGTHEQLLQQKDNYYKLYNGLENL